MKFYNFRGLHVFVTFHVGADVRFCWRRIHGFQIGRWFIGAIRSDEDFQPSAPPQEAA